MSSWACIILSDSASALDADELRTELGKRLQECELRIVPGYVLVRPVPAAAPHCGLFDGMLRDSRGLPRLVSDAEVERMAEPRAQPGQAVRIVSGPCRGLTGSLVCVDEWGIAKVRVSLRSGAREVVGKVVGA